MSSICVSVIIPIYNAEKYIDRCLESVVNQTTKNIEIILVDGGSRDKSAEKCLKWCEEDDRIIFIAQKNLKMAPARNLGIKIAKGNFVLLVDADDYIDTTMIEKMYECAVQNDSELIICDYYEIYGENNIDNKMQKCATRIPILLEKPISLFEDKNLIYKIPPVVWNRLYKRSLFIDNNIEMLDIASEDFEVTPKILLKAKKIFQVREPLYYYHKEIENQATAVMKKNERALLACKIALSEICDFYKKEGVFEEFYDVLERYIFNHSFYMVQIAEQNINKEAAGKIKEEYFQIFNKYFPKWNDNKKLLLWGNYNTMVSIERADKKYGFSLKRYSSSSLISQFSNKVNTNLEEFNIQNQFRKKMLDLDFNKKLSANPAKMFNNITHVIIDFLEERYDIIKYNDSYFTASDIFFEIDKNKIGQYEIIKRNGDEAMNLWKENCIKFIEILKQSFSPDKIILVESKLMECYGKYEAEKQFEEIQEIREINKTLTEYYTFFKTNFIGIKVVERIDEKYIFSNLEHKYGCYPYHFNSYYYVDEGEKIRNILENK